MREAVPNGTHVVVPRAGHLTNLESPGAFNSALAAFLVGLSLAAEKSI